jgi:hypothetical protein
MTRKLLALIVLSAMAITVGGMACNTQVDIDRQDETEGAT